MQNRFEELNRASAAFVSSSRCDFCFQCCYFQSCSCSVFKTFLANCLDFIFKAVTILDSSFHNFSILICYGQTIDILLLTMLARLLVLSETRYSGPQYSLMNFVHISISLLVPHSFIQKTVKCKDDRKSSFFSLPFCNFQ